MLLSFWSWQHEDKIIKKKFFLQKFNNKYIPFFFLLQNKQEQSKIRGKQLADEIIKQTILRFQAKYSEEAKSKVIKLKTESSFTIIQKLDNNILEKNDKTVTVEQILCYIRNHTEFVEKHVKESINKLKQDIQAEFTNELHQDLQSYLEKVDANTIYLHKHVNYPLQAKEYFQQLDNPEDAPKLLFKVVLSCLQGQVKQDLLSQIKQDKISAFQTNNFNQFELPLCTTIQKTDEEIQILSIFVKAFKSKIRQSIEDIKQNQIQLENLKLQDDLDALQLRQIGCLQFCPLCKRKCDQEIDDNNHTHQCQNGHQLRGMSGVLIGCHPSLYTCEEIQDDFQISQLETTTIRTWKEIKQIYNGWIFTCLNKDELEMQKEKFMKIWNDNIGRMICKQLTQEIGKDVFYTPKQEVQLGGNFKTVNYILILDDSGSMQLENRFNTAKQGLVDFLHQIEKNADSRVTIILFNDQARIVVDYEIANAEVQKQLIIQENGGTDFDAPLQIAFEKIANNKDFDKFSSHSIFFYTDGEASYPEKALEKLKNLQSEQRKKIELIACSIEEGPTILQRVVKKCQELIASAKIQSSMKPQQIAQVWIEEINPVTHQIKNC